MKYAFLSACAILVILALSRQSTSSPANTSAQSASLSFADQPVFRRATPAINGLTFVAPPEPFVQNPMPELQKVGANWIAAIPYGFTRSGVPNVRFHEAGSKWWGESPDGIRETVRLAHEAGIKVMIKPQVWIPGNWTGTLDFPSDSAWTAWEQSYERYIMRFARLADSLNVELFCIGTEFRNAIEKRPDFWFGLIKKVKAVYPGKLTYSSNWDDWDKAPFWDQLDYIGLGGYFPLVDAALPEIEQLKSAWKPIRDRLKDFSHKHNKQVLFTECGYLSVDGCGWRNWELEKGIKSRNINEQAQANCLEAMLATFQPEDWWAGSFLWKWFPNMRGHEGYPERDYTPQGKLAEQVLQRWYK